MPFDGAGFDAGRPQRKGAAPNDTAATILIVVIAAGFLVMPISMVALVDLVRYVARL